MTYHRGERVAADPEGSVERRRTLRSLEVMQAHSVRLFPGQGSFRPGCLAALHARRDVSDVLAEIDEVGSEFGYAPVAAALSDPDARGDPESDLGRDRL